MHLDQCRFWYIVYIVQWRIRGGGSLFSIFKIKYRFFLKVNERLGSKRFTFESRPSSLKSRCFRGLQGPPPRLRRGPTGYILRPFYLKFLFFWVNIKYFKNYNVILQYKWLCLLRLISGLMESDGIQILAKYS